MDGPIELPSEANPLNPRTLYHILSAASSADPQQVRTSTEQLQNWRTTPGFYSALQNVFVEYSLPRELRYLAIIQLKNGVEKYWRKTAPNAISKQEKALIRSQIIPGGLNEPDRQLALQNALVIAKIARLDYPHDWPNVINTMIDLLRSSPTPQANPLHLPRTLLILLNLVKELSTGKLQRTRTHLQSATPEIFQVLGRVYVEKVETCRGLLQSGDGDEGGAIASMETSLLALKILRRLIVAGYEFPNRQTEVLEFWHLAGNQFRDFLSLVMSQPPVPVLQVQTLMGKHLVQFSKLHLDMARTHPVSFALLPDAVSLARAYWSVIFSFGEAFSSEEFHDPSAQDSENSALVSRHIMERLCLNGFLVLRACVKMAFNPVHTFKYQHPEDKEERKQATQLLKAQLLTTDMAGEVMETVMVRYLVLRPVDLLELQKDAEDWTYREDCEGDFWEHTIKACSEKLFLDLLINFKDSLIQRLLGIFYSVCADQNANPIHREAIYSAIGTAAPVVDQHLDFNTFLNETLLQEMQIRKPGYSVIRRRIAILLGQWLPVKNGLNRQLVYQIFQHLLDPTDEFNELAVRITAGRQLENVIEPFEFEAEPFKPYAMDIITRLLALMEEVELPETKLALLSTLTVLVNRMEHHILPCADQIISGLASLWDQVEDEFLEQRAILVILSVLMASLKAESRRYHTLMLPLIKSSVEADSGTLLELLEDSLDLWHEILIQTPEPVPEALLSLMLSLFRIFELGTETLRKALEITESYLLLAPSHMLQGPIRDRFLKAFSSLLGTLKQASNGTVTHLVEIFIRAAESIGGEELVNTMGSSLMTTGFLVSLVKGLHESWEAHQTTDPNRKQTSIEGVIETDYFSVLARLALASPTVFVRTLESTALVRGEKSMELYSWLFTEWFSHFGNMGEPHKKKLMCLALTKLLETARPVILERLQDLITVWTDVITELQEGAEDTGGDSLIYWDADGLKADGPEAPEEARRRNVTFSDPVHRIHVKEFVKAHLEQAIHLCGGAEAFRRDHLTGVDQDVLRSFSELGVI